MAKNKLHDLALTMGWKLVNTDETYSNYEYTKRVGAYEVVSYTLRIKDELNELEFYTALTALQDVLPRKLKKKVKRITKNIRPENLANVVEVIRFAIEEYRAKTDYAKLKEYGALLGVDKQKMGYMFEYELPKNAYKEILRTIESRIPMKYAPKIGKIKKIEYKIGFIKNKKNFAQKEDEI